MLLRHGSGLRSGRLCGESHLPPRYGKVRAMNSPRIPGDERRTVPRHLRDSEHDSSREAPGTGSRAEDGGLKRRPWSWIYAGALVLLGIGIWFWLTAG